MKNLLRTFLAIALDQGVREGIQQIIHRLRTADAEVKWVAPDNLHLTLKFLGDIPSGRLTEIRENIRAATQQHHPFTLKIAGAGCFPSLDHPKIIWIGIDHGTDAVRELASTIEDRLETLGIATEKKDFSAHITMGRVKSSRNLTTLLRTVKSLGPLPPVEQRVTGITLYQSTLTPTGPEYRTIDSFPLGS